MVSWKWEIKDGERWLSSGIRFATESEAKAYGTNLFFRWTALIEPGRATECDDPVNYKWNPEQQRIEAYEQDTTSSRSEPTA